VRVFERTDSSGLVMQWAEKDVVGRLHQRRLSLGRIPRETAKVKADELAAQFATTAQSTAREPVTLRSLFDMYEREVSSQKGESKRRHDRRCSLMFGREFGADRDPMTLSRREWDRFILGRRRGLIVPVGCKKGRPVRDRAVGYDLRFLLAVLNWATTVGDGEGSALLDRNPLKGLPIPSEKNPERRIVTDEQYWKLREAARVRGLTPELLLVLCHETGHRVGSIRHLRWADIDLEAKTIRWRGANEKQRHEHITAITDEAAALLSRYQSTEQAIGDRWIFPLPRDDTQPISRHVVRKWWDAIAMAAEIPKGKRYGWHALRRNFASELKFIPLVDLAALGGWRSTATILQCYQMPDEATQRAGLAARKPLLSVGLA